MIRRLISIPVILGIIASPVNASGLKTPPVIPEKICEFGALTPIADLEFEPPVQDYAPSPAMWRIADDDTTIYLFGTYHILPEGFAWRTELFDQVVENVDELVIESHDDPDNTATASDMDQARIMQLFTEYRPKVPLSQRLSKHNRAKFLGLLDAFGLPRERVELAPPLMAMFGIAMAMTRAQGSERTFGVETVLKAEFDETNRSISGIEDAVQVFENLLNINTDRMISDIDKSFDEWDGCDGSELEDLVDRDWSSEHSWAKGDLDDDLTEEMTEDPFGRAFYDVLIVDRNTAWRDWVESRLERPGSILLAVGAAHMDGDHSLVLLLEQSGISIERIQ